MFNKKENKMDMEKTAKKNVLENMREEAKKMMAKKLPSMQKVEVMAKDKEGLEEGLEKAKEMASKIEAFKGKETGEEEAKEHSMLDESSLEDCSPEELDEKIAMLQALKEKKLSGKE